MFNYLKFIVIVTIITLLTACKGDSAAVSGNASSSSTDPFSTASTPNGITPIIFKIEHPKPVPYTWNQLLTILNGATVQPHTTPVASTEMSKATLRVRNDIYLVQQMIEYRLLRGPAVTCASMGDSSSDIIGVFFGYYTNAISITIICSSPLISSKVVIFDNGITGSGINEVHTYEFFATVNLNDRQENLNGYMTIDSTGTHISTRPSYVTQLSTNSMLLLNYINFDIVNDLLVNKTMQLVVASAPGTEFDPGDLITGDSGSVINPGAGSITIPYLDVAINSRQYQVAETLPTVTIGFDTNNDGTLDSLSGISVGSVADPGIF